MARPERTAHAQTRRCRDCIHSYDWHDLSLEGRPILCRCLVDAKSKQRRFCKFLSDLACEHFASRSLIR